MLEQVEIKCATCNEGCYGDVITAHGKYYHHYCFSCRVGGCDIDLAEVGFFLIDDEIYCREDYHKLLGIKCAGCMKYIEGDAISVLESTFHPTCFGCVSCGKVFPDGSEISYDGDFFCQSCNVSTSVSTNKPIATVSPQIVSEQNELASSENPCEENDEVDHPADIRPPCEDKMLSKCAGCGNVIKDGHALLALEKEWHLWCFTCNRCGVLLSAEYMGRDGIPYCEKDYQAQFGVCCAGCGGYVTGKMLQAGEKHYHPHCSRCAKCGEIFGEGEDMYIQGNEIWHTACSDESEEQKESDSDSTVSDDSEQEDAGHDKDGEISSEDSSEDSTPDVEITKPQPQNNNSVSPVPIASETTKPEKPTDDEDDEAPPIPPPPTRSSSSQWRQKYSAARSMSAPKANGETELAHSDSKVGNADNDNMAQLSVASSTNSLNSNTSSRSSSVRKGIGYNQLQYRINSNMELPLKLPTNIDPDRLRLFLDDPQHNVYLEDHEFVQIFKMTRERFYSLPQKKKQELKDGILFT